MNDKEKYKENLRGLVALGQEMLAELRSRDDSGNQADTEASLATIEYDYQKWYTEARLVLKQLIADRLEEFDQLYNGDKRSRKRVDITSFDIQDWLYGLRSGKGRDGKKRFNEIVCIYNRLSNQVQILGAAEISLDSALANIKQLVQADLFDSELEVANELAEKGFLRSAGAVAGVILENHLHQVVVNHNLKTRKKPTINNFNQLLKDNDVLDTETWRRIQLLGDIRNNCVHDNQVKPTEESVRNLIAGVDVIMHSLL